MNSQKERGERKKDTTVIFFLIIFDPFVSLVLNFKTYIKYPKLMIISSILIL